MLFTKKINGTYGGSQTPATIFTANDTHMTYYVVDGSVNVNITYESVEDGIDIETLQDIDTFTAGSPITSLEELENAINN